MSFQNDARHSHSTSKLIHSLLYILKQTHQDNDCFANKKSNLSSKNGIPRPHFLSPQKTWVSFRSSNPKNPFALNRQNWSKRQQSLRKREIKKNCLFLHFKKRNFLPLFVFLCPKKKRKAIWQMLRLNKKGRVCIFDCVRRRLRRWNAL